MRLARLLLVLALAACGGGGDPTGNNNGGGFDTFRAKIGGVDWNSEVPPNASNPQPGMYVLTATRFSGTTNNYVMAMTLTHITGPGTYRLGVNLMMRGGHVVLSQAPASGWNTQLNGQAGEVVITTVTSTRIAGTFEFDVVPQTGTTGTRTVTEGSFDLTFPTGAGVQTAANKGGVGTATVGGTLFHAAQATINYTSNNLIVLLTDDVRSVALNLASVPSSGTYALTTTAPIRTVSVSGAPGNPSAVWISNVAGGSGSVTLTVTPDRISGTFTAVVMGFGGGVTGAVNVSGSFDLGRAMP